MLAPRYDEGSVLEAPSLQQVHQRKPSGPPFAEDLTRIGPRLQALDGQLVGDSQL